MKTVFSYLYFETPTALEIHEFVEGIISSAICISHLGVKDPPPKWKGNRSDLVSLLADKNESIVKVFIKDRKADIGSTVSIYRDTRWEYSSISFYCKERQVAKDLCLHMLSFVTPHLSILTEHEEYDFSSERKWEILFKSESCSKSLLEKIGAA